MSQFEVPNSASEQANLMKDYQMAGTDPLHNQGDTMINLLSIIGSAYQLQCKYHCKEAEAVYKNELTAKQRETGWVQG